MKNKMTEIKDSKDGLHSGSDTAEERFNELKKPSREQLRRQRREYKKSRDPRKPPTFPPV